MTAMRRLLLAIAAASISVPATGQVGGYDGDLFIKALREGKTGEALKLLNDKPTVINYRDQGGRTALLITIESRETEWAGYLLQQGADPNLAGSNGETPLMVAARLGQQDIASRLISRGAKVDAANRMGETALILAVQHRHVSIVRLLLEAGADPDRPDSAAGYSARDYAKRDNRTPELLRLIEAKKPNS